MSNRCANSIYLLIMILMAGLALVLQHWGAPTFDIYSFNVGCENVPHLDADACKGDGAVYRVSMGLFLWFVFLTCGTLFGSRKFHIGWWGIKAVLFIVLIVGAFFIPNDVFGAGTSADGSQTSGSYGYAQFSRVVSALFLISQIVAFIDFAYHWNGSWVQKAYGGVDDDESDIVDKRWLAGILACCALLLILSVVGIALLYVFYGACSLSAMFITLTALAVVGFTVLQVTTADSDSSLLTSSVVAIYCVYLCWSAVNSNPATCNPGSTGSDDPGMIALGMLVAAFSLGWTCYSATASATTVTSGSAAASEEAANAAVADDMSRPLNGGRGVPSSNKLSREVEHKAGGEDDGVNSATSEAKEDALERAAAARDLAADKEGEEEDSAQPGDAGGAQPDSRLWYFHVVMAAGALYMAMLLTNWGTGSVQDESGVSPSPAGASGSGGKVIVHSSSTGLAQMWVKIVSQWLAIAIYVWTLIAPRCFPDRDFS
jgi:hypothetical protein